MHIVLEKKCAKSLKRERESPNSKWVQKVLIPIFVIQFKSYEDNYTYASASPRSVGAYQMSLTLKFKERSKTALK